MRDKESGLTLDTAGVGRFLSPETLSDDKPPMYSARDSSSESRTLIFIWLFTLFTSLVGLSVTLAENNKISCWVSIDEFQNQTRAVI